MTRIDPSAQLLAQIRAQALTVKKQVGERGPAQRSEQQRPVIAEAKGDWLAQVALAVKGISPDDPQRKRKAFRLYLQAVLARECHVSASDDPGFKELVDRVQDAMEADPRLRAAIASAGDVLLRGQVG